MAYFRIIFFLWTILLSWKSLSYTPKEGNVAVTIGPLLQKSNFPSSSQAKAPLLGGAGLIVVGDIDHKSSLEIGMFQFNKYYYREVSDSYLCEASGTILIAMGYRWWLKERLSVSLSFFSSYPVGDSRRISRDIKTGVSIDTSAEDTTEYGFDLSSQIELWKQGRVGFVADLRYSKSVTAKPNEYADHFAGLIGVRYLIQGDDKP